MANLRGVSEDREKRVALERVGEARQRRDEARQRLGREHDAFVEAIIAAAVLGCSNREIAEQAGVSFQRVSKVVRTHRLPPP